MEKVKFGVVILIASTVFTVSPSLKLKADSITTPEIISQSMSFECLDWKITGICIWLKCTLFGCFIVTTPRISHRLPDLVVSAYPQPSETPWTDVRSMLTSIHDSSQQILAGGSIAGIGNELRHPESLQFHESDVIGNPAIEILDFDKFLCKSAAQPLFPYFLSLVDHRAWRSGFPDNETPSAITPGAREIGKWPHYTWGSVYPRSGFVYQAHSAKAAAVSCQRAIDVVIGDSTGHVVNVLSRQETNIVLRGDEEATSEHDCHRSGGRWNNRESECVPQSWYQWLPKSNEKNDRWQMLLPTKSNSCMTFGETPEWRSGVIAQNGKYVWNYWAKYKCCVKAGGILLNHFDF